MKSYTLLRLNADINTVTVLLNIDGQELQQDIDSTSITDQTSLTTAVTPIINKFDTDLKALAADTPIVVQSALDKLLNVSVTVN